MASRARLLSRRDLGIGHVASSQVTLDHALNVLAAVLAALVTWAIYDLLLDTYAPMTVTASAVVSDAPVPRNGSLDIKYTLIVDRICFGEGQRFFVDASHTLYPAFVFTENTDRTSDDKIVQVGDSVTRNVSIPVPNGMAPGPATYQNRAFFYCNFWQRLTHRGLSFDYPEIGFVVSDESLPQVAPSRSIFKMTAKPRSGALEWFNRYIYPTVPGVPK